jgi:DNA repair protein RAD50
LLEKAADPHRDVLDKELRVWQSELTRIQQALPLEINSAKLRDVELPNLLQEQKKLEASRKDASAEATSLSERLEAAKVALKALQSLKQQASSINSATQRRDAALQYAKNLESVLSQGSSVKSLDEIQTELSDIQSKQSVPRSHTTILADWVLTVSRHLIDREKQKIISDRDRLNSTRRAAEAEYHQLQLRENQLQNEVKEAERLERQNADDHEAVKAAKSRIKVSLPL